MYRLACWGDFLGSKRRPKPSKCHIGARRCVPVAQRHPAHSHSPARPDPRIMLKHAPRSVSPNRAPRATNSAWGNSETVSPDKTLLAVQRAAGRQREQLDERGRVSAALLSGGNWPAVDPDGRSRPAGRSPHSSLLHCECNSVASWQHQAVEAGTPSKRLISARVHPTSGTEGPNAFDVVGHHRGEFAEQLLHLGQSH